MNINKIKVVELFGGIGAIRKALIRTIKPPNFEIIDYVENDKKTVNAYNAIYNDFYKPLDIRDYSLPNNINVDLLFHGSPCQDFSCAGKNIGGSKESKSRSSLLWETIRIIKEAQIKPKIVIWENVKNVLSKKHKPIFDAYIKALNDLGYVSHYKIINSLDCGIPQSRNRVFTVSINKNYLKQFNNLDTFNCLNNKYKNINDFLQPNVINPKYFIRTNCPSMINAIANHKIKIIENKVFTITTKQMRWNNQGVVKVEISKVPNNSNLAKMIIDNKPYYLRVITPLEAMLLMGYDQQDYERIKNFCDSQIYKFAGNSIVVNVLQEIIKHIFKLTKEE